MIYYSLKIVKISKVLVDVELTPYQHKISQRDKI